MTAPWTFDDSHGILRVLTEVEGVSARLGHRLTIDVERWHAEVTWTGIEPKAVTVTADTTSLSVVGGAGGLTPLTGAERFVASANARKCMSASAFPRVEFDSEHIVQTRSGYRLMGRLEIHGRVRDHCVDLDVSALGGVWSFAARSEVRQSDFGVKPYSAMFGALRVADAVTVTFSATHPKHG